MLNLFGLPALPLHSFTLFLTFLALFLPSSCTLFVPSFWHYCMFHVQLCCCHCPRCALFLPSVCSLFALIVPSFCPLCPPCALVLPSFCPLFALFVPSFCHSCMFHVLLPLPSLCPHFALFCTLHYTCKRGQNEGRKRAMATTHETFKNGKKRAQRGQKEGKTRNCQNAQPSCCLLSNFSLHSSCGCNPYSFSLLSPDYVSLFLYLSLFLLLKIAT